MTTLQVLKGRRILSIVALIQIFFGGFIALFVITNNLNQSMNETSRNTQVAMDLPTFVELNKKLITIEHENCSCGCPRSSTECPRGYSIEDVDRSAQVTNVAGATSRAVSEYMDIELNKRHHRSQIQCLSKEPVTTDSGGWCLAEYGKSGRGTMMLPFPDRPLEIASNHVPADETFKTNLINFIGKENMTSVSDFGAGQGQYGVEIQKAFADSLIYRGYDGAGDTPIYTQNFLQFFDLSVPLNLPVTDWVMSFEVGEHIPSQFEGTMIRNLHAHNCKGIVLSWAKADQGGHCHINNHNEEYLVDIFGQLGYVKDEEATAQVTHNMGPWDDHWLARAFVLRRRVPVC